MTEVEFYKRFDIAPRGYDPDRRYISFVQCQKCFGYVQTFPMPERSDSCTCRNVYIDVDAGRFGVEDGSTISSRTVDAFAKVASAQQGAPADVP